MFIRVKYTMNNKWWARRQSTDQFVKKREALKVVSRAYFKIKEIDENFNLMGKDQYVLDLGSSPGSWLQYLNKKSKNVYGIDILPLEIKHEKFFREDIENFLTDLTFDLIASDIAPNLSGDRIIDQGKMCHIVEVVHKFIKRSLKQKGNFVMKLFEGECTQLAVKLFKPLFKKIKMYKPDSSRKESSEIYIVCINLLHHPGECQNI